jgi:perosamine synthetase
MHAFGHPANIDAIVDLCRRWRIVLVEDAAESLGSYYRGVHTGNFGHVASLSFNGNKLVTTGGGGAILTNDPDAAARAKHLTTTARIPHRWNFTHDEVGYNYRLPNLNAALGCAQLERLPETLIRKRALAARYASEFANIPGVRFLSEPQHCTSNYWLNSIILDPQHVHEHAKVLEALNDANYMSRPIWTLMHRLPMYADCPRATVDTAEALAASVINLPSSPKLVDRV